MSDGFRLKTPLLNNRTRNLPGLKPTLRLLNRGATNDRAIRGHVIPRHSAFFRGQKKRHTHDSFSVCSVVSDGFRLQTPLLNKPMRYLRGLKPTLRFLAHAIRGHVIPRFSAFFRGQKRHTHARKTTCSASTVHNTPASAFSVP